MFEQNICWYQWLFKEITFPALFEDVKNLQLAIKPFIPKLQTQKHNSIDLVLPSCGSIFVAMRLSALFRGLKLGQLATFNAFAGAILVEKNCILLQCVQILCQIKYHHVNIFWKWGVKYSARALPEAKYQTLTVSFSLPYFLWHYHN